ncbi:MAG TPA: PaaI family thioesterase [Anaerolineales bacterium]|nr:PaaI family thioesterase [Anaerolineales bacterium]
MTKNDEINEKMMQLLKERLGERVSEFMFPPPVFTTMEGEFVAVDPDAGTLTARFPVRQRDLNPYGIMQGGMIAAAVDNTIGPLGVLVAQPNVTRSLEMTYSQPVRPAMGEILVEARLVKREDRWLHFAADVRDGDGARLARAKAVHVIV